MSESISQNQLVSLIGWYFLPNFVTGWAQSIFYAVWYRAGDPKPAPGSPRHTRDRRRIHIAVIAIYLLYTIYDADYQLRTAGDFYQELQVPHDVTSKALQSKFRRIASRFHPDKPSSPDAEATFLRLNVAKDTLADPVKRFAYDRFGPEMLSWQHVSTIGDYIWRGFKSYGGYYGGTAFSVLALSGTGFLKGGSFWRFWVMAALFVVEFHAMTRPYFPAYLTKVVNPVLLTTGARAPYLPFQMMALLRKLSVTIFIALAQLAPLLQGPQQGPAAKASDEAIPSPQLLDRLDGVAQMLEAENDRLLALELAPFVAEDSVMKALRKSIRDWLVQNTVRSDAGVKQAVKEVFERRRLEGGMGVQDGEGEGVVMG